MNFFKAIAYMIKWIVLFFVAAGLIWYLFGHWNIRDPMDGGTFVERKIERTVSL